MVQNPGGESFPTFPSGGYAHVHRVQKILNFCARVVTGRRRYDHVSDVFHYLRWMCAGELAYGIFQDKSTNA